MQRQVRAVAIEERGYAEIISVGLLLAILAGFALFLYCRAEEQTVPITGRTQRVALSEEDQARLGADAYRDILAESATEIVRSGPEAELVQRVGERIAAVADDPGFEWEFTLIASPLKNAWCLPGGKVAVYSGILEVAQDEEGLAVVMAHEIAHAIAQHGAERMLQEQLTRVGLLALSTTLGGLDPAARGTVLALFGAGAQLGVLLPFSRDMESEADRIGLIYMARAGYNPAAAAGFWQRMAAAREGPEPPEYASTHPSNASRIADIEKWLPEAMEEYRETLGALPAKPPLLHAWVRHPDGAPAAASHGDAILATPRFTPGHPGTAAGDLNPPWGSEPGDPSGFPLGKGGGPQPLTPTNRAAVPHPNLSPCSQPRTPRQNPTSTAPA